MRRGAAIAGGALLAVLIGALAFFFAAPPGVVGKPVAASPPGPAGPSIPHAEQPLLPKPPPDDADRDPTKPSPEQLAGEGTAAGPPPDWLPDLPPPADDRVPLDAAGLAEARRNGTLGADPERLRPDQIGADGDLRLRPGQKVPPPVEDEHPPENDTDR